MPLTFICDGKTMPLDVQIENQSFTHIFIWTFGIMAADSVVRAHWKGQMIRNPAVKNVLCIKPGIYNYD